MKRFAMRVVCTLQQHALRAQALFGNLGSHKLAPAVEARAEFLTAAVGDDGPAQLAQVRVAPDLRDRRPCASASDHLLL